MAAICSPTGQWSAGLEHGAGILVDVGGLITRGTWRHGTLVKPEGERQPTSPSSLVAKGSADVAEVESDGSESVRETSCGSAGVYAVC